MQVVECKQCGLMYLSPRPTARAIESWYGSDYFSGEAAENGRGYSDYFADDRICDLLAIARQKLALVSHHFSFQGARVLELGCATGETCYAASQEGASVVGWDLSTHAIQVARSRYPDLEFEIGSTEQLPFAPDSLDAVLAFELIEHVASPSDLIREVHRVLRPGGVLALTTPNANCGRRVGWHQWTGFLTSFEHLYFFNSESLRQTFSATGMSVVGVYSQGEGRISSSKAASLKKLLRRVGLFGPAKTLFRAVMGPATEAWLPSDDFHTLMTIARKT